jgi:hypothetical protein
MLDFAQHEQLPQPVGKAVDRRCQGVGGIGLQQLRFGIVERSIVAVILLVELIDCDVCGAAVPAPARVAHDAQEPGTPAAAGKRVEVAQRPQRSLLDYVLRVMFVAGEPPRQPHRSLVMRQNDFVEVQVRAARRAPHFGHAIH